MHRSGFSRMDKEIQKDLRDAEATGNPEVIKEAHRRARGHYRGGIGAMAGGILGTIICPGLGTYIGAGIGNWLGYHVED